MNAGRDPYFLHYYRINFDGSGLTAITESDADHLVSYSTDMTYYVDTYGRVDLASVSELRRTADRSLVTEVERGDVDPASTLQVARALLKAGKIFDLLIVPGANHGAGRSDDYASYGDRKRFDFFVQHLLGQQPPDWNMPSPGSTQ